MKIEIFFKTVLFLLLASLWGCASKESLQPPDPLWNTWHIPKAPTVLRISFTPDGRMVGVMGLNNFFAPVQYFKGNRIRIHAIALSRRGEYPDFADRFFKVLRSTEYAAVSGKKLLLFDKDQKKIMTLERMIP